MEFDPQPPPPVQPPPPAPAAFQPPAPSAEAPVEFAPAVSQLRFMAKETVARAALGGLVAGLAPAVLIYGFVLLVLPALLVIPTLCLAVFLCGDAVVHGRPKSVDRTNKRIAYGSVITIFIVFSNGLSAAGEFGFAMVGGYATAAATGAIICSGLRWWRIESKRAPHPQR